MLLRTGGFAPGTVNPIATGLKQILKANRQRWRNQGYLAPLDPLALSRKYGGDAAYAPRLKQATFRVPLQVSDQALKKEQAHKVWKWLHVMAQDGWDWCSDRKIDIFPGHYPAYDLDSKGRTRAVLDAREFVARAWFKQRKPEFVRTEIRPELLEPLWLPGADPTVGGLRHG